MKKISILVDQFYEHGGIEKLVALKANYWSTVFNYDVTIVATENKDKPYIYPLEQSINFLDLGVNYNRDKSYFSIENIRLLFKNILKIQSYIFKEKPDFVVVASHIPITYILPFLKLGKTKIVKEFHFTQYYRKDDRSLKKKIFNIIESKYDKLIVLSQEERSYYKTDNVVVIPNPIPKIQILDKIDKKPEKEKIASAVVRFAPVKRLEVMIDIWNTFIKRGNKDWILYIYGDHNNEYGAKIKTLVNKFNLSKYIVFKGQIDNVLENLVGSRVLLLTSSQECFPMVILESYSVGVPVISFDCPTGPRNIIINEKDGILIKNNSIDTFVKRLESFALDEVVQGEMSKKALLSAQKYTMDKVMNMWKKEVFI